MKMEQRDILVVGHPRSGHGFMAKLLQNFGLNVAYEAVDKSGTAAWTYGLLHPPSPARIAGATDRDDVSFRHVIHLVRNPLKVIASTVHTILTDSGCRDLLRRFVNWPTSASPLEQAVRSYLVWNRIIAARNPGLRVRVEDCAAELTRFLIEKQLIEAVSRKVPFPKGPIHAHSHPAITWSEIQNGVSTELFEELGSLAREFGYSASDDTPQHNAPATSNVAVVPSSITSKLNPKSCVILVPAFQFVESRCETALRELEARGYTVWRVFGFAAIDLARNIMTERALKAGFEELLWIDADEAFDVEEVERLRSHRLPIVAGLYAKKGQRALASELLPGTKRIVFGKGGGLTPIRYAGTGFLLTHRSVYDTIQRTLDLPRCNESPHRGESFYPFFQPMSVKDGDGLWYLGEDYAFCERARQSGYEILADTTIRLYHIGSYTYGWEDAGGSGAQRVGTYHYHITQ